MTHATDSLIQSLPALDIRVLNAADFPALAVSLVEWAMYVGADAAYIGVPDAHGWLQPGALAGEGMSEYAAHARVSIHVRGAEGGGPIGRAWRARQPLIERLPSWSGEEGRLPPPAVPWSTCAVVPLTHDGRTGGVLCLFGCKADHFATADWTTALAHVELTARISLDRMHQGAELARLRGLALHDSLTGLPNMTALEHYLEHAVQRARRARLPLVVGLLDLDRFKPVNDLFGHDAGDRVLREVAARIQASLRESDFVARMAGDEFVIVLEGVHNPVASLVPFLDQLHARLTQPMEIDDVSWQCGATLGLALWPITTASRSADVLAEADRALRESKTQRTSRTRWWNWAHRESAVCLPASGQDASTSVSLYGSEWTTGLALLSGALQREAAGIVHDFYQRLARLPRSRLILDELTGFELQHLKAQQVQNLFTLADGSLTESDHRTMALRVGRIHAMVGLDHEELVRTRGILIAAVHGRLAGRDHDEAVGVFGRRLNRDLAWQSEAYQQLQDERQQVLLRIARLAWKSESYADLIDSVVAILGAYDEVAGCSISRPDRQGLFRVEAASGRILGRQPVERVSVGGAARDGAGLAGTAWRSRTVERCVNVATDPRMTPWRALAQREGLRAGVAIPLCQPGQPPMAILTMYGAFPGGYSSSDQMAFIDLLQTLLVFAMSRIANQQGPTRTVPYATRRRWAALLRSDALQMYCQPILDLKTGTVTKVEMLARIFEGSRPLMPAEFLPVLTSDDLLELYTRGLDQALAHRALWLRDGNGLNVSVNLPSSAFGDIRYFDATHRALAKHECQPGVLTLEILETDALPSDIDVGAELVRYRTLGVKLAEDDLGAGHSSLGRLRDLPFDCIKIDRSIVSLAGQNKSDILNFVYQLTRLGHALGKSVIVEGVEDDALLEAAVILQADAAQGYRIAKPMPAHQLTEWMARSPALPASTARPKSALGKLARLLIWEERLHLIVGDPEAFVQLARLVRSEPIGSASGRVEPVMPPFCQACPLTKFFVDIEAALQDDVTDSMEQQALLDAAITHGLGSAAYGFARQCLIDTFDIDAQAA